MVRPEHETVILARWHLAHVCVPPPMPAHAPVQVSTRVLRRTCWSPGAVRRRGPGRVAGRRPSCPRGARGSRLVEQMRGETRELVSVAAAAHEERAVSGPSAGPRSCG